MNCAYFFIGDSISRSESHRSRSLVRSTNKVDEDLSEPRQ